LQKSAQGHEKKGNRGLGSDDLVSEGSAHPPSIMHDYQRKRLAEFAIHKCFILNDMFLAVWEEQEPKD